MEEEVPSGSDNVVTEYNTYEDFLDSQITPLDLYYLEVLCDAYLLVLSILNVESISYFTERLTSVSLSHSQCQSQSPQRGDVDDGPDGLAPIRVLFRHRRSCTTR